ncbi:MAG: transcription elongation factor GreA [Sulfurospirillaceae bacterium]|nr:transcription elongation factor GreA [Sulfurospirillaceae bacterium]
MIKEPMTNFGFQKLNEELNDLKKNQRPHIVQEIDIARSHGDLKENAEYHAAREKQSFIESRIAELSDLMTRAHVIDPSSYEHDKVRFGTTVVLEDLDSGDEIIYTLVGSTESNPDKGLISFHSPLAKQLFGKEEGSEIVVTLPSGEKEFEILSIYYEEISFE